MKPENFTLAFLLLALTGVLLGCSIHPQCSVKLVSWQSASSLKYSHHAIWEMAKYIGVQYETIKSHTCKEFTQ